MAIVYGIIMDYDLEDHPTNRRWLISIVHPCVDGITLKRCGCGGMIDWQQDETLRKTGGSNLAMSPGGTPSHHPFLDGDFP